MKNTAWLGPLRCGDRDPVRVIGAINVSPESFFAGSVKTTARSLAVAARAMQRDGADIIDVGAMSTAPYLKTKISESEEARRLAWAVRVIRDHCDVPVSIDTSRFGPAEAGLDAGATILNDVTGFAADPRLPVLAQHARGVILMAHPLNRIHRPRTPIDGVRAALTASLKRALAAGVAEKRIVMDPGIGFFRKEKWRWWKWDLAVLRNLPSLRSLGRPLLIGVSRKSFIGEALGGLGANDRLPGSLAATVAAVAQGARLVRTHDVAATRQALQIWEAIASSSRHASWPGSRF